MKSQLIYGTHPVAALLEHQPQQIRRVFIGQPASRPATRTARATKPGKKPAAKRAGASNRDKKTQATTALPARLERLEELARQHGIGVESVNQQWFEERFANVPHQRVAVEYLPRPLLGLKDLASHLEEQQQQQQGKQDRVLLLVLDGIEDPQNVGACLRVAAGMGASAVVMPANRSVSLTPVVHKAAAGAAAVLPVFHVSNLGQALAHLKEQGFWIYGAAGDAPESLPAIDFSQSIAIVMGSEGSGLRERTRGLCDQLFRIPMPGPVESFNVSVAAGIALYAVRSQWDPADS